MGRLGRLLLWFAIIFVCASVQAQVSIDYIITVRRSGRIEFIDPVTLKTISSISVSVSPSNRTGLDGVFANPDGRAIYVEGPAGAGCCWLYSIDLATLETKRVAGIWGTRSRHAFINVSPSLMQPVSPTAANATEKPEGDQWQTSPDGRWWFGLRNGPALDLYDVARGEITRSFAATTVDESSWSIGTWLGNRFFVYAEPGGSGRLWTVSPESTQLGDGIQFQNWAQSLDVRVKLSEKSPQREIVYCCMRFSEPKSTAENNAMLCQEAPGSWTLQRDSWYGW